MGVEPLNTEDYWKAVINWAAPRKWYNMSFGQFKINLRII